MLQIFQCTTTNCYSLFYIEKDKTYSKVTGVGNKIKNYNMTNFKLVTKLDNIEIKLAQFLIKINNQIVI